MRSSLLVIAVVVIALIGGCASCGYYAYSWMKDAYDETRPIVDAFQSRWNAEDHEGIYELFACTGYGLTGFRLSAQPP